MIIHRAHDNEGYKTLDGIDVCGLRVAQEIQDTIKDLNQSGKVIKISIVGYSLGGLISRYCIGILHHQGIFDEIEPINFTTFCTPHVGVLTPGDNISVRLFNQIVPSLLSLSGKQMFLKDHEFRHKSLLSLMGNTNSVFYQGLKNFKHRQLYANAINDKRTAWWTSGISIVDPFIKITERSSLDSLSFTYIESYEPIVIDSNSKFIISNKAISNEESPKVEDVLMAESGFWHRKLKWLSFVGNFIFFIPLWVIWFIGSNLIESVKSYRRIKNNFAENALYFAKLADITEIDKITEGENDEIEEDDEYYDVESIKSVFFEDHKLMENTLQDRADDLMESLWGAMTSKDVVESAKFEKFEIKAIENTVIEEDEVLASIMDLSYFEKDSEQAKNEVLKAFTLDLTQEQLDIVKNLNELHWEKYPILIRHTTSTHSASIVRNIDEAALYEGKTVVRHWLNEVFKLE